MTAERDTKDGPFCWQSKAALRRILDSFDDDEGRACRTRSVYLALCEIASDEGAAQFIVSKGLLAFRAGLSARTVQRVFPDLERAGVLTIERNARREPREQQVAAMSRRFKLLAHAINCPVFLLAQLNRESEKEDRRPRLSDLRESGSIEQDADRVWFLYRPKPAPSEPSAAEDASEIDVALYQCKCRNGPAGIDAVLRFNRPLFTFTT